MIQNVQILPRNEAYWQDNEWKKLLSTAIRDPNELLRLLELDIAELPYQLDKDQSFKTLVPLSFVERMQKTDPSDPLLLQVLPLSEESIRVSGYSNDPLGESTALAQTGMAGLLHKYQSRVLFMLATHCAVNCRYCFRREFPYQENRASKQDWHQLATYLKKNPQINEVIISGGDPLAVNDAYLVEFVAFIEQIPQIIRLRIHTRLPVVIPQRVTSKLLSLTKSRLQMVMVMHVNHPNEIDDKFTSAMHKLAQAGFTLLNQSTLLKGINDCPKILSELSEVLFSAKVTPYYLHMLDRVNGAAHFAVSNKDANVIYKQLQANLAGFLVPKLVQEKSGEPNKTLVDLTI
ncbi:EF-P beta-lysylation protein EpmB [Kangiella sp. HZ709]|uniref:EF-P beta-lysylation protein EpmB n=1 Tax=Kangiella sp. HZ709 TaxID=2666328 RepID=UPI0012B132E2|nr:EF-P beta-lysylation protein EpmB [Kangiella sp. HZ709]MRX28530.1 EF-P beta-lysylation protein EpmB [Kangiella sp. HZ709]